MEVVAEGGGFFSLEVVAEGGGFFSLEVVAEGGGFFSLEVVAEGGGFLFRFSEDCSDTADGRAGGLAAYYVE